MLVLQQLSEICSEVEAEVHSTTATVTFSDLLNILSSQLLGVWKNLRLIIQKGRCILGQALGSLGGSHQII